jgi:putative addiction module antidote
MEGAMVKLKLTTIGTSTGVVLPKEVLSRLKLEKGDTLYLTEAPDGYRITPYNPDFEDKMAKAEDIIGRYRNTLRVLAQ